MSDHRMALLPFSTLATYAPDGDQDTELMAELEERSSTQMTGTLIGQNKRYPPADASFYISPAPRSETRCDWPNSNQVPER